MTRMIGYSNAQCDDQKSYLLELEEIFKRNTFTRDEVDHLTKLLHSRSQEVVSEIKEERIGTSKEVVQSRKDIVTPSIGQRNMIRNTHFKNFSTPSRSMKIMDDIASPVELAKAYMSSRPSKLPPSTMGLRNQMFKGDVTPFRNPVFLSTFSRTPSYQMSSGNDIRDCNSMIPRFHGRSALYNMARTPYSRVRPVNVSQGSSPMADSCERPSSSRNTFKQNDPSNYKQTLKRRSSVLDDDDDVPSSGPLRRTRQKQNLLIEKSVPQNIGPSFTRGANSYNDADLSSPSTSRYPLLDGSAIKDSLTQIDSRISRGSNLYSIPSQSTETAAKILQHLDKLVPSTKERMPELKITATGEGSSAILAKNSFQNDFKIFKNEDGVKLKKVVSSAPLDHEISISTPNGDSSKVAKLEGIIENGTFVPSSPGISIDVNLKNPVDKNIFVEVTKSVIPSFSEQAHKKRSFRMSAQEDYIDLDEDIKGTSSSSVSMKAEPDCNGVAGSNSLPAKLDLPKIQPPGKLKRPASSVFAKIPEPKTTKNFADFERKDGFSFQNASNQSMPSSATFSGLVKPSFALPPPLPLAAESVSSLDGFLNNKIESGSMFSFASSKPHSNLVENQTSNHATVEAVSSDVAVITKADEPPKFVPLSPPPPDCAPPPPSKNIAIEPAPSLPAPSSSSTSPTLAPSSSTSPLAIAATTAPFSPPSPFFTTTSANPFSSSSIFRPLSSSSPSPNPFSSSSSSSIFAPSSTTVNPFPVSSSPSIFSSTAGSGTNAIFSLTTSVATTTTPIPPTTTFAGFSNSTSLSLVSAPLFKFETPASGSFPPPSSASAARTTPSGAELSVPTSGGLFSSSFPLSIPNRPSAPLFGSSAAPSPSVFSFASGTPSGSSSASHGSGGGVFGAPAAGFSFGQPSAAPASSPAAFGSGNGVFLFSSSAAAANASSPPAGNDQMSVEDGMAEDNMAEIVPPAPALFSPPPPASSFIFGGTPPAVGGPVFQFGGGAPAGQTAAPSPFPPSGNVGFGGGGDFSMGSGGGGVDKSNRKFIKVKHRQQRRK